LNTLAQAVGVAALRDVEYLQRSRKFVSEQREALCRELLAFKQLIVFPGAAISCS